MHDNRAKEDNTLIERSRIDHRTIDNLILKQIDIQNILAQLKMNYDHQLIFKLAVSTGMKPQEIVQIQLNDIDHESESIKISSSKPFQNSSYREIGLSKNLYLELYRFTDSFKKNGYLFQGRWGQMSWRSLSYILSKVTLSDGSRLTMKIMQDAVAMTHLRNGFSIKELAYILGYKNKIALRRRLKKVSRVENGRIELFNSIFLKSA